MDKLIDTKDSTVCVQQIRYGKYVVMYVHMLLLEYTCKRCFFQLSHRCIPLLPKLYVS